MLDFADNATKRSHIRKDIESLFTADYSKMNDEEKEAMARKALELADIAIPNLYVDGAAFGATYDDINDADVSSLRKLGAHAANVLGLTGVIPGWGNLTDAATYELLGWLLTNPSQTTELKTTKE